METKSVPVPINEASQRRIIQLCLKALRRKAERERLEAEKKATG